MVTPLTFIIIHLRRGDHRIVWILGLAVLTFTLNVRVQHQTW